MASYDPVRLAYNVVDPVVNAAKNLSPIIFFHGATGSKEHWCDIPQVVANATGRKAYVLDARNHGDSEWSDEFNFDILAHDVLHFMDLHNVAKAVLIGHSMGGVTAYKTALSKPDRIEAIIVEDMLVRKVPKPILDNVVSFIKSLRRSILDVPPDFDEDGARKCITESLIRDIPQNFKREAANPYLDLKRSAYGRWAFKANMEVLQRALSDGITLMKEPEGQYMGPASFTYGVLSPFLVGKDEFHIKKFFPNAEFIPIDDASHDVHKEKPLQFTEAVLKFLYKIQ